MLGKRNLRKDMFTLAHGFQRKHDYRSVMYLATRPECSGSRDRDTLTLHSCSLLHCFRAWERCCHMQVGSSSLSETCLETFVETQLQVCFHGNSKLSQVDNED